MKLYDVTRAPNPRRARIFIAEKGLPMPELIQLDLAGLEHRKPEFARLNPWMGTPALVLDDGTVISESVAICRYFEELHPTPALFGTGARERALVEMWSRRLEFGLYTNIAQTFRHTNPHMAHREVPQVAAWGEANRERALIQLQLIDDHLSDGRPFICGEQFSIADITGGISLDFARVPKIAAPPELTHLAAWHARLISRPSWGA
ncbi:MAG: glutathione S-transferase [Hyphomicrobiales bacterium]|nr:glutathione S-transferase [Hyphomicrobiales bacterium]